MRKLLILLTASLALSACSNEPSMGDIRTHLENILIENGEDKLFAIEDLERIQGHKQGEDSFVVEIKYNLVFKTSLAGYKQELKKEAGSPLQSFVNALRAFNMRLRYGKFEQGSKIEKVETFTFYKSENGWSLEQNPQLDKESTLAETSSI